MTKCPYVPPHEWNVDFPHLMLRAKVKAFEDGKAIAPRQDPELDGHRRLARRHSGRRRSRERRQRARSSGRKLLEKTLGVDADAPVPKYHSQAARARGSRIASAATRSRSRRGDTQGRVAVFATCYGNRNHPGLVEDLVAVLEHNDIGVALRRQRALLRHAEARARRSEVDRAAQGGQHRRARRASARRLGSHGRRAVVRADVQAGAAAVVSRGRARAARRRGVLRSVRVPDAAAPRRASSARISRRASARSAIRCRATCACRTSA